MSHVPNLPNHPRYSAHLERSESFILSCFLSAKTFRMFRTCRMFRIFRTLRDILHTSNVPNRSFFPVFFQLRPFACSEHVACSESSEHFEIFCTPRTFRIVHSFLYSFSRKCHIYFMVITSISEEGTSEQHHFKKVKTLC
jgi:hypothetical protein